MRILNRLDGLPGPGWLYGVVISSGEIIHSYQLLRVAVENGGERTWQRVVVVLRVVRVDDVHVVLEQPTVLILVVSPIDPGVVAHCDAWRELHFLNLRLDGWVLHADCFHFNHLVDVTRALYRVQ